MTTFAPKITYRVAATNINPVFMQGDLPSPNWPSAHTGELPYGWVGELTYPNNIGFENHFQLYRDMVAWIQDNINNPTGNVTWNKIGDCIYVQFRKEKDMFWFKLRFGV